MGLSDGKKSKLKRVAKALVGPLFLLSMLLMVGTRHYFTLHGGERANPSSGRTIRAELNFGRVVYLTTSERRFLELSYLLAGVGGVAFVLRVHVELNRRNQERT